MSNMPDINIIKYLPVNIKKAFDKGEIDKLYKKMYETSENIAAKETDIYINTMALKDEERMLGLSKKDPSDLLASKIPEYKNSRIQFHLDYMFKLLELYAKSKSVNP